MATHLKRAKVHFQVEFNHPYQLTHALLKQFQRIECQSSAFFFGISEHSARLAVQHAHRFRTTRLLSDIRLSRNKSQHRKCKTPTSISFLMRIIRPAFHGSEDEHSHVSAFALPGAFTRNEIHTAGTVPRYSGTPMLFGPLAIT